MLIPCSAHWLAAQQLLLTTTEQFHRETTPSSSGQPFLWKMCTTASRGDTTWNVQHGLDFAEVLKHLRVNFGEKCRGLVLVRFEREKNVGKVRTVRAGEFTFQDYSSKVFSTTTLKTRLFHIISLLYVIFTSEIIISPSELHTVNYFLRELCI